MYISLFFALLACKFTSAKKNVDCTKDVCRLHQDSLNFIILGDWGGDKKAPFTTPTQLKVAKSVGEVATNTKADFILSPGDQFYKSGVKDVDDSRFQVTFENVYTTQSLYIPWYMTIGNHDADGNVSAQIAYSKKSTRWFFPERFYTISYVVDKSVRVNFVEIDTVVLCGDSDDDDEDKGPTITPANAKLAEKKWKWIEDQLATFSKYKNTVSSNQ